MIHTLLKHYGILVKKLLFRTNHILKRSLMGTFTLIIVPKQNVTPLKTIQSYFQPLNSENII